MKRQVLVMCVLAVCAASCKSSSTSPTPIPAGPSTVLVPNGASVGQGPGYAPASLTVTAGTTVTWGNNDGVVHTTTADAGQWDSQSVNAGMTFAFKFNTPGTFKYHCTLHSFMIGTIVVQ